MFDITGKTLKPVTDVRPSDEMERWWNTLIEEGRAKKATESLQHSLSSTEIETLARQAFDEVSVRAVDAGVSLPQEYILRLIGDLSGMGPLLELIARSDIEDIAINLGHIYVYTTTNGWEYAGAAPDGIGDALRVMIDRAGQRAPTPDYPVADAMLQVMVPLADGSIRRKGVRINYVMHPASPYGDTITLRVSNYRTTSDLEHGSLAMLCQKRLPPVPRPRFDAKDFPRGDGILTPEVANYLLSVMVHGGTLVIAGTTGSGKTSVGQRILQEMLDYYPRGAIRLFIVEDSNEIILQEVTQTEAAEIRKALGRVYSLILSWGEERKKGIVSLDKSEAVQERKPMPNGAVSIPQGKYFTIAQVAEMCAVKERTVSTWLTKGLIRGLNLPGLGQIVEQKEIEKYLAKKRNTS